ncbi:MAG: hypothetical protein J7L15_01385 [Clostridiales bacterium]|nr:hypothetical protein [Clostridiales bacterium]
MARNKEPGVISQVWDQAGKTTVNTGASLENTTGLFKDGLVLARESIKPSIIDGRVETLTAMAEGIKDLEELGISAEEARAYLMQGI